MAPAGQPGREAEQAPVAQCPGVRPLRECKSQPEADTPSGGSLTKHQADRILQPDIRIMARKIYCFVVDET